MGTTSNEIPANQSRLAVAELCDLVGRRAFSQPVNPQLFHLLLATEHRDGGGLFFIKLG